MTATAMNDTHDTSAPYEVGYGKPPRRTQFRKGQSGNPGGRPRRLPVQRANALLLKEAYRCVAIKENGRMVPVMALQAILRSQVELAMNGNLRAQRYVLEEVRHLELLKAHGFYSETDFDETDGFDELDEVGEGDEEDEADESDEADETGESWEEDETDEVGESDEEDERSEEDETGEGDDIGSDDAGAVVTAADPAAPPENGGTAPPVFSAVPPVRPAAPEAPLPVDSALPRPAAPSRRRRTPARAHSRGGRRHAVTEKPARGGGPAARKPGRIPRGNSGSAESRKIPC